MNKFYKSSKQKLENSGLQVTFDSPIVVKKISGVNITSKNVIINEMIDSPSEKKVTVRTNNNQTYTLWKGDAYTAIGQWTDQNVTDRLKQLIEQGVKE
jgi:hypothetical protein